MRLLRRARGDSDAIAPGGDAGGSVREERPGAKGRPTPKRREAQRRRTGPPEKPPTSRKEAYRRTREKQAEQRAGQRSRMVAGEPDALLPRDRGPERALVRDLVDSRRSIANVFLPVAVVVLVSNFVPNLYVKSLAFSTMLVFTLFALIDLGILGVTVHKTVRQRYPDTTQRTRSLVLYASSRATVLRRWRAPKPRVQVGDPV